MVVGVENTLKRIIQEEVVDLQVEILTGSCVSSRVTEQIVVRGVDERLCELVGLCAFRYARSRGVGIRVVL